MGVKGEWYKKNLPFSHLLTGILFLFLWEIGGWILKEIHSVQIACMCRLKVWPNFSVFSWLCCRENRITSGETINIVGALKKAGLRPELEDDVLLGMEVDSLNEVKFFTRVQIRGRIIHSRVYKRVSVRNSYTISCKDGNQIKYGQVELFVQAFSPPNNAVKHAAVVLPFQEQTGFICQEHEVLGVCPVTHILGWYPPLNDQCILIPIDNIKDLCICMEIYKRHWISLHNSLPW